MDNLKQIILFFITLISLYLLLNVAMYRSLSLVLAPNQLVLSRLFLIIYIGGFILFFAQNKHLLLNFFLASDSPHKLAVFRILFFGFFTAGLLVYPQGFNELIYPWVNLPPETRQPIALIGSVYFYLPFNELLLKTILYIWVISCVFSFIGYKTKFFMAIAAIGTLYLFGVSQNFGKITHAHYFVWWAIILALSPCADVWSVDAWLKKRKGTINTAVAVHTKYALPIRMAWLFIGVAYFFPGFYKLWDCGFDWIFTDNLLNKMYYLWDMQGYIPSFRVDNFPAFVKFGAFFTIFIELSFIFLLFIPPFWRLLGVASILLHTFIWYFLGIFFMLLPLPAIFLFWSKNNNKPALNRDDIATTHVNTAFKESTHLLKVCMLLLFLNVFCGVFKIDSWPVACFPLFNNITTDTYPTLVYYVNDSASTYDKQPLRDYIKYYVLEKMENDIIYTLATKENKEELQEVCDKIANFMLELNIKEKSYKSIDSVTFSIQQRTIHPDRKEEVLAEHYLTTWKK